MIPQLDKLVHASMFAVWAGLWCLARPARRRATTWLALVAAAGVVLAVGTEWAQSLPAVHRDPDPIDVLADLTGVGLALAVYRSRV